LLLVLGDARSVLNSRVAYTLKLMNLVAVDDFYFLGLSEPLPRGIPALSRIVGTKLVSFGRNFHFNLCNVNIYVEGEEISFFCSGERK
jgi:hypothetical protein